MFKEINKELIKLMKDVRKGLAFVRKTETRLFYCYLGILSIIYFMIIIDFINYMMKFNFVMLKYFIDIWK
jgi:uncharacterized membrane protein YukC